ncbi:hypothetical protein PM082_003761 [Marasmius tenuissimus]|nr:hypothetical protein PM082_003761 [Marasmius tenuissimus]
MVVLVSSDGKEFTVERDVAEHLTLINGPQLEETNEPIPLPGVPSAGLEKVLEYCEHHRGETLEENKHSEWDRHFVGGVDQETLFLIIQVANYLEIQPLVHLGSSAVADLIKGKTLEQIRTMFNIANDHEPSAVQATPVRQG